MTQLTLTRFKAAAQQATPPQQATETEEDLVTINWILFDKSDPDEYEPLSIDIPRARFNGKLQNCQKLFVSEILDFLSLSVRQKTIKFWRVSGNRSSFQDNTNTSQPKQPTQLNTVAQARWKESMNDIKDHFNRILYSQSFATELEDIDNNDIIHWPSPPHVLWSKSIARRTIWRTSFPKFDVRYIALYHLRVYLTSLQATKRSFRPQANRRLPV
jgi:hypothetical protein